LDPLKKGGGKKPREDPKTTTEGKEESGLRTEEGGGKGVEVAAYRKKARDQKSLETEQNVWGMLEVRCHRYYTLQEMGKAKFKSKKKKRHQPWPKRGGH